MVGRRRRACPRDRLRSPVARFIRCKARPHGLGREGREPGGRTTGQSVRDARGNGALLRGPGGQEGPRPRGQSSGRHGGDSVFVPRQRCECLGRERVRRARRPHRPVQGARRQGPVIGRGVGRACARNGPCRQATSDRRDHPRAGARDPVRSHRRGCDRHRHGRLDRGAAGEPVLRPRSRGGGRSRGTRHVARSECPGRRSRQVLRAACR